MFSSAVQLLPPDTTDFSRPLQSFIDQKGVSADWAEEIGNAMAINIPSRLPTVDKCQQFVAAQRYVCCNCWARNSETARRRHGEQSLVHRKQQLYIERLRLNGCEQPACPFAGRTDVLLQLHHIVACHRETQQNIGSGMSVKDFIEYLQSANLVVRCEMCHRLEHPETPICTH